MILAFHFRRPDPDKVRRLFNLLKRTVYVSYHFVSSVIIYALSVALLATVLLFDAGLSLQMCSSVANALIYSRSHLHRTIMYYCFNLDSKNMQDFCPRVHMA